MESILLQGKIASISMQWVRKQIILFFDDNGQETSKYRIFWILRELIQSIKFCKKFSLAVEGDIGAPELDIFNLKLIPWMISLKNFGIVKTLCTVEAPGRTTIRAC